jgi:hypothetical protein
MNAHVFEFRGETFTPCPPARSTGRPSVFWRVRPAHRQSRTRRAPRRPDAAALRRHRHAPAPVRRHRATAPKTVVCLGDSFDDAAAAHALDEVTAAHLTPLMAGRAWIWIEGNHDPGPLGLGGTHLATLHVACHVFRHIAEPGARARFPATTTRRPAQDAGPFDHAALFSARRRRMILPAYGTYTGGLFCDAPELDGIMAKDATAILLGTPPIAVPMPRRSATDPRISRLPR